jgi:hypothetical protein
MAINNGEKYRFALLRQVYKQQKCFDIVKPIKLEILPDVMSVWCAD